MDIQGKAVVISGAGSGIGRAMALAFAARGASVVAADINEAGGRETVALVAAAGGSAVFQPCDVTRTADLEAMLAAAPAAFGRLDIVCNNAGIGGENLFEDEAGAWQRMVAINFTAVLDATRLAVRALRKGPGGVIVNTASMGGLVPMPSAPVYAATKAGVVNLCRSLAHLAAESNIRVNALCPSYADTPLVWRDGAERVRAVSERLGGLVRPEDVALGAVEIVEDDSRAGAVMRVTVSNGRDYARDLRP